MQVTIGQAVPLGVEIGGISVAAQQQGCLLLDAYGEVVRPAPLWNNTASVPDVDDLNAQAGFGRAVGSRLVASFTITKLVHLARAAMQPSLSHGRLLSHRRSLTCL